LCYFAAHDGRMERVGIKELRQSASAVIRRVEQLGESVEVTVQGRSMAIIGPVGTRGGRARTVPTEVFERGLADLENGRHWLGSRTRRQHRLTLLDQFDNEWLPFDRNAATGYAQLAARVHATRPTHSRSKDIMLAGQALSLGASFATLNPEDFELVADLVPIVVPHRRHRN